MKTLEIPNNKECSDMPEFERINYFYGQDLSVADFQIEQEYFLNKLRLMNRCFHGTGIVCGLEVNVPPPSSDCDSYNQQERDRIDEELAKIEDEIKALSELGDKNPKDELEKKIAELEARVEELTRAREQLEDCEPQDIPSSREIVINCGWAIDCHGREIIVRSPKMLDLFSLLSRADRRSLEEMNDKSKGQAVFELSICYCEQGTYPTRPRAVDQCDPGSSCKYARTREGFRFKLSLSHHPEDTRCSNCCEDSDCECVVLAHVHWPHKGPLKAEHIDLSPRRPVSVYQTSVIEGISWRHGAVYSAEDAKLVLGTETKSNPRTDGIEVHFSKPVYAETLQPGVVTLIRMQSGPGLSGIISQVEGSYVDKPAAGLVSSFKYRDDSGETLNSGDRLMIIIRCNFILDGCCKPVDGEHVGGLVPQLEKYEGKPSAESTPPRPPCCSQVEPWTSGNGNPGAKFESWFYVD